MPGTVPPLHRLACHHPLRHSPLRENGGIPFMVRARQVVLREERDRRDVEDHDDRDLHERKLIENRGGNGAWHRLSRKRHER